VNVPLPFTIEMTSPGFALVHADNMHIIRSRGPRSERICRYSKKVAC
jgi:hypothetical protein